MSIESFISDYQRRTKPLPVPPIYRRRGSMAWRCRLAPGGKAEVRVKLVEGELVLDFIGSAEHGKGYGTAALTWLCVMADIHQVKLILNVVGNMTFFGALRMTSGRANDPVLTPRGLRGWYKRHGFVTYKRMAEGGVMMRRFPQQGVPVPALVKTLHESDGQRHERGKFTCICGRKFIARISDVWHGRVKSCGCYRRRCCRIRKGEQQ